MIKSKTLRSSFVFVITLIFIVSSSNAEAAFADVEIGAGSVEASKMDASIIASVSIDATTTGTGEMEPGDSETASATIENTTGSENFNYRVEYDEISDPSNLCDELQLEARQDKGGGMVSVYTGALSGFAHNDGGSSYTLLTTGSSHDWEFIVSLPANAQNSLEGLLCDFDFTVIAWDTAFTDPVGSTGWGDGEVLNGNEIDTGDWAPVITDVAAINPNYTQGSANGIDIEIIWDTGENATSNVVYDTVSHDPISVDPYTDYASAEPAVEDATADNTSHSVTLTGLSDITTYYYRVVSDDAGAQESYSAEYSFTIDSTVAPVTGVVLNEFLPDPAGSTDTALMPSGEWVELYNQDGSPYDLAGWTIENSSGGDVTTISISNSDANGNTSDGGETIIPAGGYLVVYLADPGSAEHLANAAPDSLYLLDNLSVLKDSTTFDATDFDPGKTFARFPDGGVWIDPEETAGESNRFTDSIEEDYYKIVVSESCFNENGDFIAEINEEIGEYINPFCNPIFVHYLDLFKDRENGNFKLNNEKTVESNEDKMSEYREEANNCSNLDNVSNNLICEDIFLSYLGFFCGNDKIEGVEQCDDGNTEDGDGCSSVCEVESYCGDGRLDENNNKQCDDENNDNGDGCSDICEKEEESIEEINESEENLVSGGNSVFLYDSVIDFDNDEHDKNKQDEKEEESEIEIAHDSDVIEDDSNIGGGEEIVDVVEDSVEEVEDIRKEEAVDEGMGIEDEIDGENIEGVTEDLQEEILDIVSSGGEEEGELDGVDLENEEIALEEAVTAERATDDIEEGEGSESTEGNGSTTNEDLVYFLNEGQEGRRFAYNTDSGDEIV